MPVGQNLIQSVFRILKTDEGKTPKQVCFLLKQAGIDVTARAVRYALKTLVDTGRATRNEAVYGQNDRFYFAVAGDIIVGDDPTLHPQWTPESRENVAKWFNENMPARLRS